ncbi:MAG: hypothetical protein EA406_13245 [Rhodospirillales bacterium]|nr:MAG: hypothetical protein EA406_13245 [Rhodospirillales bacterium]
MLITAAALAATLALGACGSSGRDSGPRCPGVRLLADAATMTQFAPGAGRDLTDVDYQVAFTDVEAECRLVQSRREGSAMVVAVAPVMTAMRGPANSDRRASFSYLVSVLGRDDTILNVQRFPVAVEFPGNLTRVTVTDDNPPVIISIPLPEGGDGRAYDIVIGFHLTPEQLDYNRQRDGQAR